MVSYRKFVHYNVPIKYHRAIIWKCHGHVRYNAVAKARKNMLRGGGEYWL